MDLQILGFLVGLVVVFLCVRHWCWRRRNIDKIYYINLDRSPNRRSHVLAQFRSEGVQQDKVVRFRAIDGKTHNFTAEELAMFEGADFKHGASKNLLMGNQLSHYYILRDIVDKKHQRALILQDDVVLKKGFLKHLDDVLKNMPDDAEIVNLGFHKFAMFDVFVPVELEDPKQNKAVCAQAVNDYVCKWDNDANPCSLAYIVTLQGAKNLLAHFQEVGFRQATDHNYNNYLQAKGIFYGSRTVLCTSAPMGSSIFGPSA